MRSMDIKALLKTRCLVTDGAMGTYYNQRYGRAGQAPECDNLTHPERIEAIHREYIRAGANLIRTNSFASNKETLFGRAAAGVLAEESLHKVYENVYASYKIAQQAVAKEQNLSKEGGDKQEIYIAGDIGPLPWHGNQDNEDAYEVYKTMAKAHLDAGAKILWFETFADLKGILPVIEWIKSENDVFIMVSFSINKFGYTKSGISAASLVNQVKEASQIDGIGFNCGVGPAHLRHILRRLDFGELIVFAAPNAGYADKISDRSIYRENPSYFCETMEGIAALGVNLLGGCCGTSPSYIELLSEKFNGRKLGKRLNVHVSSGDEHALNFDKNMFLKQLYSGKKIVIAELDPPHDANDSKLLLAADCLKRAGVEMITFSDSPMGKMRADSMMSAVKIASETGMDVMPHISCRDKNAIGMGASLLGAYMNGIRNFLVVTGDPVPSGDRDMITPVYDFNSVRLLSYIRRMNEEYFKDEPVACGGALNYGRKNIDVEIERMRKKCEAGAMFFLTQPIYSDDDIERIRYIKSKIDTKILCGILPLVSYRNAVFMKNEVTGIHVPEAIVERYDGTMSRECAEGVGIDIAVEIAGKLSDVADGYYFMVPFNRASMIAEIVKRMSELCLI